VVVVVVVVVVVLAIVVMSYDVEWCQRMSESIEREK